MSSYNWKGVVLLKPNFLFSVEMVDMRRSNMIAPWAHSIYPSHTCKFVVTNWTTFIGSFGPNDHSRVVVAQVSRRQFNFLSGEFLCTKVLTACRLNGLVLRTPETFQAKSFLLVACRKWRLLCRLQHLK